MEEHNNSMVNRGRNCNTQRVGIKNMEPLPPLPPLPSLWRERRRKRLLGWATVAAILCAIGVGMLHGLGGKIFEMLWPTLQRLPWW